MKITISTQQDKRFVLGMMITPTASITVDYDALHDSQKEELRDAQAISIHAGKVPHVVTRDLDLAEVKSSKAPAPDAAEKAAADKAAADKAAADKAAAEKAAAAAKATSGARK
jgi:membrane protein involved in colicin uptake